MLGSSKGSKKKKKKKETTENIKTPKADKTLKEKEPAPTASVTTEALPKKDNPLKSTVEMPKEKTHKDGDTKKPKAPKKA